MFMYISPNWTTSRPVSDFEVPGEKKEAQNVAGGLFVSAPDSRN